MKLFDLLDGSSVGVLDWRMPAPTLSEILISAKLVALRDDTRTLSSLTEIHLPPRMHFTPFRLAMKLLGDLSMPPTGPWIELKFCSANVLYWAAGARGHFIHGPRDELIVQMTTRALEGL